MKTLLATLTLAASLVSCSSIVAPGQTRAEMDDSGATLWAVTEYDFNGSHFVWVPHWAEGLLNVSTPKASNCKKLDVLEFKGDTLVGVQQLGDNRDKWAAVLRSHGRIETPADGSMVAGLYMAVTERIVILGAPVEHVLFAIGFPSHGPNANPSVKRAPSDIRRNDVLYYLGTSGGQAFEVVVRDGRVAEKREAQHLSKDWIPFYSTVR